jgi:molybdopterin/thiamine biosynthesis adenylyltransferase
MKPYDTNNERVKKFFGDINLKNVVVTIIGLGGGGEIILHLLRSGIQKFNLIDFDTLETGNLVRHICGSKYIGQNKAIAVKNLLEDYQGKKSDYIKAYTWNIFDNHKAFDKIIKSSSVVIIATDTDSSKSYINELCVKHRIPAVFVSMFHEGCGGEVFTYIPDLACYDCIGRYHERQEYIEKYAKTLEKKDCSSNRDIKAMPGLGIDQSFLCSIAARKVLDCILSENENNILPPIGQNMIIWSLYGIKNVFEQHLSSIQILYKPHKDCSCNN